MKRLLIAAMVSLGISLGVMATQGVWAWQAPEDCADEDRTVKGNSNSDCKASVPTISHIEYKVVMDYPDCVEGMVIQMPGSLAPEESVRVTILKSNGLNPSELWGKLPRMIRDGDVLVVGKRWGLNSIVEGSGFGNPTTAKPNIAVMAVGSLSNWVERPRTDAVVELVNACLDMVRQEKEDREHQAAVDKAETESAARIAAQQEADRKAEIQAQRDAESQAQIAAQELAAAQESKRRTAATELLKTKTLETQIQHEEVIAGILRDIMRIRLAGQEDRARITQEYLIRAEEAAVSFDEETSETEKRIQAYLDFNAALLERLQEYQDDIEVRLERVRVAIEEQQANIDSLEEDAKAFADVDVESTPEPE